MTAGRALLKGLSVRRSMIALLSVVMIAVFMSTVPASGATSDSDGDYDADYVTVELKSPPAIKYAGGINNLNATTPTGGRFDPDSQAYASYQKHLEKEHANFIRKLQRTAPGAEVVDQFFATSNAVVVKLNGNTKSAVQNTPGATKTHDVAMYAPTMNESVLLINADDVWGNLVGGAESAGRGVNVGVIDSGIYRWHDMFACKGPIEIRYYYSGETGLPAYDWSTGSPELPSENAGIKGTPYLFVSPHGTHVAGTIAGCADTEIASGPFAGTTVSGVAPGANLFDYNVFPGFGAGWVAFGGSAFSHDIAAAIEDAVVDGMDVINMSLGGTVQGPHDFLQEVSNTAAEAIVVVTSAGNEGPGNWTVGSPGSAEKAISVGASTNTRGLGLFVQIPDEADIDAVPGDFPNFSGDPAHLMNWPGSDPRACSSDVPDDSLSGETVLIDRGVCSFSLKVQNAKVAGAGGVIVATDATRPVAIGMARDPAYPDDRLPAVMVSYPDGQTIRTLIGDAGGPIVGVVVTPPIVAPTHPNDIAGFSSRGPVPFTGIVKPDLMAPGVNILSSVFSGYELFSGTSMASPHVAGAAAILVGEHSTWTPVDVKSALVTTTTGEGYEVWEQGSGLLDVLAATNTNALFSATNASFGIFQGKKPVSGSVDISINSTESCFVDADKSTDDPYVSADISGDVLTVEYDGGREAPSGLHQGRLIVTCGSQDHTITWGTVIDRKG